MVRQRLKLAAVSPKLLEVYAEDGMTVEQLMAFTVTGDHARQEQVWDQLQTGHSREPYVIRRMLTDGVIRATDKRVRFVGIDAYEAAGGVVLRDLFEQDQGGWLQDSALLDKLVAEKLRAEVETIRAEGWKWIEAANEFPYGHAAGLRRLTGEIVPLDDEGQARVDALRAEHEKLEAQCDTGEFSSEIDQRLDAIEAELKAIERRPLAYEPEEVSRAGAFVSITADGMLRVERGYVRSEDEPKVEPEEVEACGESTASPPPSDRLADAGNSTGVNEAAMPAAEDEPRDDDGLKPLSDRLVTELTSFKTLALRDALGNDPDAAFLAVLHALCLKAFYHFGADSCLEIEARSAGFANQAPGLADSAPARAIEERHRRWADQLPREPEALWDALTAFDGDSRAMLFAHCAALTVNAVHEPYQRHPKALAHADRLGDAIGLDLVEAGWMPTAENYLGRVPKARILEAVREAKGDQAAELIDHLKKGDMAREAERLLEGSGWLPEPLRGLEVSRPSTDDPATDGPVAVDDMADLPAFLAADLPEAIAAE
ncbi:MAG: DNA-binding protein [Hyphomicrobiales bacterium]